MIRLAAPLLLCAACFFVPMQIKAQTSGQTSSEGAAWPSVSAQTPAVSTQAPAVSTQRPSAGQMPAPAHVFIPMHVPTLSPGVLELLKLEGEFSASVTAGGGKAFSSWFADDGVTLNNGKPAVQGRTAIAAAANWDPARYKLSWYAEGAQMSPEKDAGFTWGHYDAVSVDNAGKSTTLTGRYITFWKKEKGEWKVALDASADEPPFTNGLPTP